MMSDKDEQQWPMSAEELVNTKQWLEETAAELRGIDHPEKRRLAAIAVQTYVFDVMPMLLAEVDRLRAREAALTEIAEAVARLRAEHFTSVVIAYYAADVEPIQAKARALLAEGEGQ